MYISFHTVGCFCCVVLQAQVYRQGTVAMKIRIRLCHTYVKALPVPYNSSTYRYAIGVVQQARALKLASADRGAAAVETLYCAVVSNEENASNKPIKPARC